jgi:hypothetical protein
MDEKRCELTGCDDPVSTCMIPDHPDMCGVHLEEWYKEKVQRIVDEQMYENGHPDPVGV